MRMVWTGLLGAVALAGCSQPAPSPAADNRTDEQRRHDAALKSLKETQDQVARMKAQAAAQDQPANTSAKNDR